jgi:2-oxoglutarate dehydrogenase E2 component (dihydrolipoamide succinyltransferase)
VSIVELKIPQVGESITDVQVGEWLKGEGDWVERDQAVATIDTDKAAVEVSSPAAGVLVKIVVGAGNAARVGDVIGHVDTDAARPGGPAGSQTPAATASTAAPVPPTPAPQVEAPRVMPAAERVIAQQGLDPKEITPTGPGGRILKEDALRHAPAPAPTAAPSPAPAPAPAAASSQLVPGSRTEEVVPMTGMRKRIAQRLVSAQHTGALLTTFNEVDMTEVIQLRKQYQDDFQKRHGVKLGFMSFFVKATVDALRNLPQLNAEIRGEDIVYHHYQDIGIAVGGGKGLVVPILRNAENMSFSEIEKAIGDFGRRAKDNRLTVSELSGGTFTISNGGVYGSLLSTPIVNPPQSGILGLHAIQERPVARNGQVVIRSMMYVALTYDHRLIDGRESVTFLKHIKDMVENPVRLLLDI